MAGALAIRGGDPWPLLELVGRNFSNWLRQDRRLLAMARAGASWLGGGNTLHAAADNVRRHYDLDEQLYRQFLDPDLQYSCAYFRRPSMSLAEAQEAKKRHLIAKLAIEPGHRVLDMGSGWGGLALSIAESVPGVSVLGVTLSREQLRYAQRRARQAGLDDRVRFELCDYRRVEGRFDRIVSVGMFEHVGRSDHATFFHKIAALLRDEGVALIHSIARKGRRGGSNPWLNKYIFPGGYIPSLTEIAAAIEGVDLWITDIEALRLHYAETLRCWRINFSAHRTSVNGLYGERFCRMWEFYLASCEMAFRYGDLMVLQVQLARRIDALPVTRDYMFDAEREGAAIPLESPLKD
ncbi:MAG TPA: cyclopropane-fatty-acyl-phospholipid synthase family protein [Caulobacterales bacterium]|nr:cyclopropane-fatty-acyl-phospholipid synthase family protein [Caulobacterales bacterium]